MIRLATRGPLAILVLAASGCKTTSTTYNEPVPTLHAYYAFSRAAAEPAAPPALGLSAERVARAREKARARAASFHEDALEAVFAVKKATFKNPAACLASTVSAVEECYGLGDRDAAEELTCGTRGVYAFDKAAGVATIACRYRYGPACPGGALAVSITRKPGVTGPLAIAFPPGTFGTALVADGDGDKWTDPDDERRYHDWPSQQDLAFLKAPVVRLDADDDEVSFDVPIACASFHAGPPANDQPYSLRRFEKGSPADRLLLALCAREKTNESEAQLALWLARNDISWPDYVAKGGPQGGIVTFGGLSPVLPRHARGAAKVIMAADLDPSTLRFFGGSGIVAPPVEAPQQQTICDPEQLKAVEKTPEKPTGEAVP